MLLFEIFQIFNAALFGYRATSNWSQKGPMTITSLVDSDFATLFCHCHCHCQMSCHLYRLLGEEEEIRGSSKCYDYLLKR